MKRIFLSLLMFSALYLSAQQVGAQWWGNYTYSQLLNERWNIGARLDVQYFDVSQNYTRKAVGSQVGYRPQKSLKYLFGTRMFVYDTSTRDGVLECRPWLGLSHSMKNSNALSISQFLRLEQRFFNDGNSNESRMRYRLRLGKTVYKHKKQSLQVSFSPELFLSFGDLDAANYTNTRLGMPIAYTYNQHLKVELLPFLQANHASLLELSDQHFAVLQLRMKTFF